MGELLHATLNVVAVPMELEDRASVYEFRIAKFDMLPVERLARFDVSVVAAKEGVVKAVAVKEETVMVDTVMDDTSIVVAVIFPPVPFRVIV